MSTPNPLQPQGALTSASQGKSNLRLTILAILAVHAVVLGGLLLQGCDKNAGTTGSSAAAPPPGPSLTDLPPLTPPTPYYETTDPTQYVTAPPAEPAPTNAYIPAIPPAQPATPVVETVPPAFPATPDPGLAPVASTPTEHKIARGDTLGALAAKHGTTVRAIEALNPGVDPRRLQVGQTLLIPPPRPKAAAAAAGSTPDSGEVYTVKSGDTLLRISRQFGTTPREIRALNGLKSDRILVGQKLKIPARAPAATAAAPAAGGGKQF